MKITLNGSMKNGDPITSVVDLTKAQPIPELKRDSHGAWVCHAEIAMIGGVTGFNLPAVRFVALIDSTDVDLDGVTSLDEIRARFLIWNGEFSERVDTPYRFRDLELSIGGGKPFHTQTATDDPRDLVVPDGTFILVGERSFGQEFLGITPDVRVGGTYEGLDVARPTTKAFSAALKRAPWVDYVRDTNQQGSPGSVTALLDEGCMAYLSMKDDLAPHMGGYMRAAEEAAAFNASQCGRRRINYFTVIDGRFELFTAADAKGVDYDERHGLKLGKLKIEQDSWVIRDPTKDDTKDGEFAGSKYATIVRAWDEQHEFRLLRHAYQLAFFPDPLIWAVAHGRAQAVMTSPFFQNPNDGNGNQRRAWMLDSLAEYAAAVDAGILTDHSAEVLSQVKDALQVAVVRSYEGRGVTVNVIAPHVPVRWLSRNLQPGRGHYGNTQMAFQTAVQVNAHARTSRLAFNLPGTATAEGGDGRAYALRCMRQAALSLDDMATMRQEYAPTGEDGKAGWGPSFYGTTAYDCDTREGHQCTYVAGPGGGFHSTFRWVAAARARAFLIDLASGQPAWVGRATGVGPQLLAYFKKSDALRPADSQHFHIGEAAHMAHALVVGGLHETGYRE